MITTLTGRIANGVVTLDDPVDARLAGRVTIMLATSEPSVRGEDDRMLRFGMFPELRSLDIEEEVAAIRRESDQAFERKWGPSDAGH